MASYFLAPGKLQVTQFIPGGAVPANGAQLFLYAAGSVSTKQTAYKDNAGSAQWANPIVLDSGGNLPSGGQIWFLSGQTYKAVLAPSNDTDPPASPYWNEDNQPGINDVTGSQTEWVVGPVGTFVSGTQFTLVGDQTPNFKISRRIKAAVTAGTVFGSISSVSFGGGLTTVNVTFVSGALDSGLTGNAVSYSLIAPDNPSINADYVYKQASSVASAGSGTTNIWGVAGNSAHVTGTNAIFHFSTAPYAGAQRTVIFDSVLSLNSSAANAMPGNLNVTTAANDRAIAYADTTTSTIISFYKASGKPVVAGTASTGIGISGENISINVSSMSNSLGGDVGLTSTTIFFTGPTIPQGTTGTWLASGNVTVVDTTAAGARFVAKLWDGTSIIDSAVVDTATTNAATAISLSGVISNPAGNIRISVIDATSINGLIKFNLSGASKDSTLSAIRIA